MKHLTCSLSAGDGEVFRAPYGMRHQVVLNEKWVYKAPWLPDRDGLNMSYLAHYVGSLKEREISAPVNIVTRVTETIASIGLYTGQQILLLSSEVHLALQPKAIIGIRFQGRRMKSYDEGINCY